MFSFSNWSLFSSCHSFQQWGFAGVLDDGLAVTLSSICPYIRSQWKQVHQGTLDIPQPSQTLYLTLGDPKVSPSPKKMHHPSSDFRVFPGFLSQCKMPGTFPKGGAQEASWSDIGSTPLWLLLCFELPLDNGAPRSCHHLKEAHFDLYYLGSYSFGHENLMVIGKDWNIDKSVNQELCLLIQLSLHHKRGTRALPTRLFFSCSILLLTKHQDNSTPLLVAATNHYAEA